MRRFFRWMLKVLILIVVGLISFSTAMRFAIHGRESAVPNFVGLSPQQAEQVAMHNGLLLSREDRFYSAEIPAGHIVSQEPAPGTKVRRGWRVRIAESLGPQRVTIPSVIGDSERAAELNLQRRGLDVGSVATISTPELPQDQIVAQSPPPDAQGITSPKVNILYNAPVQAEQDFVMPDFVGSKLAEAVVAVTDAGFKVGNVHTVVAADAQNGSTTNGNGSNGNHSSGVGSNGNGSSSANGQKSAKAKNAPTGADIVGQSPAPGSKITKGATINFDVVRN